MLGSTLLLAHVMSVAPASPAQQEQIDLGTEQYSTKDYAAAAATLGALVDPPDANVDLSHKEWHNLLKFAARSFLEVADQSTNSEEKKLALSRGIKLCSRYENSVARNLAADHPLVSPRDCALLREKLDEMDRAAVPANPPVPEKPQETTKGQAGGVQTTPGEIDLAKRSQLVVRQKVGVGFASAGGVLLLTAGALGLATRRTGEQYLNMSCADTYLAECMELYDRGRGLASAQWSTLAVGGALAVTGILLAVIPPRRTTARIVQPVFGPRHAGFVLSWNF